MRRIAQPGPAGQLLRLDGKIALVTGAGSGIGRYAACSLAQAGAIVIATDRDGDACSETCKAFPDRMSPLTCDVTDLPSVRVCLEMVWQTHVALDVLVNCAGVYSMQSMLEVTEAEFDRVMAINLKGLFFLSQAVAKYMIQAGGGGSIVNVASAAGRRPSAGSLVYSASKAAVISMTQAMAQELAAYSIRVNAIAPGAVETPMWDLVKVAYSKDQAHDAPTMEASLLAATPLGRLCRPQDCADAILYLCSDQSSFITAQTLNVDGGMYFN